MRRFALIIFLAAVVATSGCGPEPAAKSGEPAAKPAPAGQLVVAGSGTNLPITEKLALAYAAKTGAAISVPASIGSGGAVNAVAAGELSLGLISRPLTPKEKAAGLRELPYARVAIVFAANSSVPDADISTAVALDIIRGTKTTWADGSKIYVLVRERSDSSNTVLYDAIPGYKKALADAYATNRWQVLYTDAAAADAIRRTPGAFGLADSTQFAATPTGIRPLAFEGVPPTRKNIENGSYPFVKDLSFVYKDALTKPAAEFVDFVFSAAGGEIIGQGDGVPLGR